LQIIDSERIDLAILDIMMPGMDGYALSKKVRDKSNCLIVFLTARAEECDKLKGFEHGSVEYVTKPFSPKVLVARVDALLNLKRDEAQMFEKGEIAIDMQSYVVRVAGLRVELTPKEYELLFLLVKNEGRVLRRSVIIDHVWGYDYYGDGRVLDTNIKTLRKKISVCAGYIKTVIGIGYKFEVERHD
jgi:DNA-binding response OmpR family regulator